MYNSSEIWLHIYGDMGQKLCPVGKSWSTDVILGYEVWEFFIFLLKQLAPYSRRNRYWGLG